MVLNEAHPRTMVLEAPRDRREVACFADDDQLRMLVLATSVATAGLMLPTVRRARSSKLAAPAMNLLDQIGRAMSGGGGSDRD